FRQALRVGGDGGFSVAPIDWASLSPPLRRGEEPSPEHADLAASVQTRLEEVLLELGRWLRERTGLDELALAGGVALNCVANARLAAEGPFRRVWVQPAAGDGGTAMGAALYTS